MPTAVEEGETSYTSAASIIGGTRMTGDACLFVLGGREVAAQAVDRTGGDDVERRGLLARLEATEARDLQGVLGRGTGAGNWA